MLYFFFHVFALEHCLNLVRNSLHNKHRYGNLIEFFIVVKNRVVQKYLVTKVEQMQMNLNMLVLNYLQLFLHCCLNQM